MIAALLLALQTDQSPASLTGSDVLAGLVLAVLGFLALLAVRREGQKRKRMKALRDAHRFTPPNVHGSAGQASKKDAKAKGWLK